MPRKPTRDLDPDELDERREANEMFYLDEAGNKQDADIHNRILRAVDYPIVESIMKPIRDKHRKAYEAKKGRK